MSKETMIGVDAPVYMVDESGSALPAFELDPAAYAADVEHFDMTEDQKREFLETIWSIMRSFVDLGFSFDVCSYLFRDFNEVSGPTANAVKSSNQDIDSHSASVERKG